MKYLISFILVFAINISAFTGIDSVKANLVTKIVEHSCHTTFDSKWTFVPIADYPLEMRGKVKVPDFSRGVVYCCKSGIGGIVWSDNDTACVLVKEWYRSVDTTYMFLWFAYNKYLNKLIYLK
jgi:hypothetical protein